MGFDSSPEEGPLLLNSFFDSNMEEPHEPSSSNISIAVPRPSATLIYQNGVQEQNSLITPPPELRLRAANPEPQQDPCQQASQSASQAIRQASQQASDSVRQASQQASQSADAASRSASDGIRQAQQSASQSIAQASRSVDSAVSSASSAISSMSSSASSAISRAQASASSAQADASKAVLNAGAAVAAATGKAAAAGSSFLAAAASATESAQASISAFGSAAASQINEASEQAKASQTSAITATQTALAIVGSIIASALITILIYFLISRHKKQKKSKAKKARGEKSPDSSPSPTSQFSPDSKFPISEKVGGITGQNLQGTYTATKNNDSGTGEASPPKRTYSSIIKSTSVPWNPLNPPKPPSLGSWLKLQDGVSPFGPIKLPTDEEAKGPLGGQLRSPLQFQSKDIRAPSPQAPPFLSSTTAAIKNPHFVARSANNSQPPLHPNFASTLPLRSPTIPNLMQVNKTTKTIIETLLTPPPSREDSIKLAPPSPSPLMNNTLQIPDAYRESQASAWTDDVPASPQIATQAYRMEVPEPRAEISRQRDPVVQRVNNPFTAMLPKSRYVRPEAGVRKINARGGGGGGGGENLGGRLGLPVQPGPQRNGTVRSLEGEMGFVDDRDSRGGRRDGERERDADGRRRNNGTEVGKAM